MLQSPSFLGSSLVAQWLGFTALAQGSVSGGGTEIPQAAWLGQKTKKESLFSYFETSASSKLSELVSLNPESLVPFRGLEPRTEQHLKFSSLGIPWWPCGWDSAFSLPGPGFHPWLGN